MPAVGKDDPEMAYRRGYQYGATQTFQAVERFLDPVTRTAVQELDEQILTARVIEIYRTISRNEEIASPTSRDVFESLERTNLSSS